MSYLYNAGSGESTSAGRLIFPYGEADEIEINDGTFYMISLGGVSDTPDLSQSFYDRSFAHGQIASAGAFYTGRDISVEGKVQLNPGEGDMNDLRLMWARLKKAFSLNNKGLRTAGLQFPGEELKFVKARIASQLVYAEREQPTQWIPVREFQFTLHAPDPRIYSALKSTASGQVPVSGGAPFPWTFPLTFSSGTGASLVATNDGDFYSPVVVRLYGELVNPRLVLQSTGEYLEYQDTILSGQYVEFNSLEKTVLIGGSTPRYSKLSANSSFFEIPPGANSLILVADGGSGWAEVDYWDTWI